MIRVGIIGASGYTAIESIRWLLRHPEVTITAATSRQGDGSPISDMHPEFENRLPISVEDLSPKQIAERCDVAFCCLPHGASAHHVMELLNAGCRVIDLSADYRLSTPELYLRWYGETHPDPARLGATPYGLPELFNDQLADTDLIANPGCYPTSAILPLAPLLKQGLIEPAGIVVDSKSGVSGAGRTPKLGNLYGECNESIAAYSVGNHRHQPEIVDILHRFSGVSPELVFTPHLVPMERGILSTIYVRPAPSVTANQIRDCLLCFYQEKPFVRAVSHLPATRFVAHTNYCDITVRENGSWIVLLSTIDNLVKGASGAAVQNLNCMFGLNATTGLIP
ncbi:MAG: N-acetyl-gamma-glutamyl-phosphate reductase [Pirellulaceae bacterium]|nr:N-acetyl-gamma-glutamyl-phosphate reductase [Pirellulaceae bacterium]